MYEYHGWFGLSESTEESDTGGLADAIAQLEAMLPTDLSSEVATLTRLNGEHFLTVTGNPNRKRETWLDDVLDFVRTRLPGSFGMLYERADSMDEPPGQNAFRVTVLARGELSVRLDPFLSPCNPVIED